MFQEIKQQIDIVEGISKELQTEFKRVGENTFEPEDKECPFCGHKDCFRIKNSDIEQYYNCFSCGEKGDLIRFIEKSRNLKPVDAVKLLAKEWNIQLPTNSFSIQELLELAAHYYEICFQTTKSRFHELGKLSPFEYQTQVRNHKPITLEAFRIGWSDGSLITYLQALGYDNELLMQTGLMNKKGKDFLPSKVFVYPHIVNGKVSHFTFKDPLKQTQYQLPTINKLNNHIFYNSDSIRDSKIIAIVEGENDVLSIHESGWQHGLVATNGQLSAQQSDWLIKNAHSKEIITFFDSDQAGEKYREKIESIKNKFSLITQIKLIGYKDIDEYLTKGGKLNEAISANNVSVVVSSGKNIEDSIIPNEINIVERENCYYKIKYKGDEAKFTKLTNFIIKLRHIYIRGNERQREVIFIKQDGKQSEPVPVDSDSKVSLKSFRVFAANAIDGSFYGQENDLISMWEYIYSQSVERIVYVPEMVGRVDQFKGWLFRDLFISDTGMVTRPDEEGIIWFPGKYSGVKAMSLTLTNSGKEKVGAIDIPSLNSNASAEERTELLAGLIQNLCKNLGNTGMALTMLGWAKANAYSDLMFNKVQGFPFLFFWGKHGQGKTVIAKWLASIYNMDENGYASIPQFKSGVGFGRKLAYYASLPMVVDEVRADGLTIEQYGTFRSWYQRAGRYLGMKEDVRIREQPVRSNFIFAGQDQFTDGATRERCIPVRIPVSGRDKESTYNWIEQRKSDLNKIGYHWIIESTKVSTKDLYDHYEYLDKMLVSGGCESRPAKNWACVGIFAKSLADEFMPKFNYDEYILNASKTSISEEYENNIVAQFFSVIEGMMASENNPFTDEHIRRDGDRLYVWFREVFRLVQKEYRGITRENFTEGAIRAALIEEKYCVGESVKKDMGINRTKHRVFVIDLKHPEIMDSLINISLKCMK